MTDPENKEEFVPDVEKVSKFFIPEGVGEVFIPDEDDEPEIKSNLIDSLDFISTKNDQLAQDLGINESVIEAVKFGMKFGSGPSSLDHIKFPLPKNLEN